LMKPEQLTPTWTILCCKLLPFVITAAWNIVSAQ
jgi:hypothetical protein